MSETSQRRRRRGSDRSDSSSSRSSRSARRALPFGAATVIRGVIFVSICFAGFIWIIGHRDTESVVETHGIDPGWRSDGASRSLEKAAVALAAKPPVPDDAVAAAKTALVASPMNVGALSALAEAAKLKGGDAEASPYRSLILKRTVRDLESLRWELDELYKASKFDELMLTADALLRVDSTGAYGRYTIGMLALLTQIDAARKPLVERLKLKPIWAGAFFDTLATYGPVDMFPVVMEETEDRRLNRGWGNYLSRLLRTGDSRKAYAIWTGLLPPERMADLSFITNGSFESKPNSLQFDWMLTPQKGVETAIVSGDAYDGNSSLSVTFSGAPTDYSNARQILILDPGTYRLTGMVKADRLETERGLVWRLICYGNNRATSVGVSQPFSGTMNWSPFNIDFTIPDTGCDYQALRLDLPARIAAERQIKGRIWFDKLAIQPDSVEPTVTPTAGG